MAKTTKHSAAPTRRTKRTACIRPTIKMQTIDDVDVLGFQWPDAWISLNMWSGGRYIGIMYFNRECAMKLATTVIEACVHFDQLNSVELACIEKVARSGRQLATRRNGAVIEAPAAAG